MAETKTVNLNVETNLGSLKSQLKEAQRDVEKLSEKFGATSVEATNAAKKAAQLKDAIGDAKALTDAFNPDAKFNALGGALQGVAGGFSAVQGAMGLFGVESKDLEATMLKVQSAMAFSQGINSVMGAKDAFTNLAAVIGKTAIGQQALNVVQVIGTAVMKALNFVMKQNPILLIVAGITAAVAAFKYFSSSTETATEKNEKLNASLERQQRALDRNSASIKQSGENRLKILVAQGASEQNIHDQTLRNLNNDEKARQKNVDFLKEKLKEKRAILKQAYLDEDTDLIKSVKKEVSETKGKYIDLVSQKKNNITNIRVEEITYKNKVKADEDEKTAKQQEENRKRIADNKAKNAKIAEDNKIAAEKHKQELIDNANDLNASLLASDQARQKAKEEQAVADAKMRADGLEALKENAKAQLKINEEESAAAKLLQNQKIDAVQSTLSTIGNLAELFAGKSRKQQETAFKIQKAANIANATIDAFKAANGAYSSLSAIPVVGVGLGIAAAGAALTAGLLNVKKISATKFEGGGATGGGGSNPSIGGGGGAPQSVITPNFNIVGNNGTNQLEQLKQAPIQAYVVSGEMSTQQSLDRNRLRNATL
jgi:hypothetical protein